MIAGAVFGFDKRMPYPSLFTLVPTVGAALVILFASAETWTGRFLGARPLVAIGLMSYSAYLWHWPLFVFARHKSVPSVPGRALMGALSVAALALGYLSWRYVETPFRNRGKVTRRRIFAFAALGSAGLVAAGLVGVLTKGYSGRIPSASINRSPDIEFLWVKTGGCMYQPGGDLPVGHRGVECWLGDKTASQTGTKTGTKTAIIFGDSYAGAYDGLWDVVGKKTALRINSVTTNWCMPTRTKDWTGHGDTYLQQCLFNRRFFVENIAKYDVVILGGNWMVYSEINRFDAVLDLIDFAASRTKLVVVMAAPKQFDVNPVDAYNKCVLEKRPFDITQMAAAVDVEEARANHLLEEASKKYKNVLYIDRDSMFNVDGVPSDVTKDNMPFSLEGNHISASGSRAAGACFLQSQKYRDFVSLLQM